MTRTKVSAMRGGKRKSAGGSNSHKKTSNKKARHADDSDDGGFGRQRKRSRSNTPGPSKSAHYERMFLTDEENLACYYPLPRTPAQPPTPAFFQRLHDELEQYNAAHVPTAAMTAARWTLIGHARDAARDLWGEQVDVLPFGSFVTGLYIGSSDVDLVVMHVQCGRKQIAVLLRALGNRLRSRGVARDVTLIPSARVPLLKYVDVASGLDVDISLGIMDGVLSANLMKKQSESYPAFRPLTLFLKAFMQARGLADVFKGGVSSYILQCMLLFHLQVQQMMHASKATTNAANGAVAPASSGGGGSMSNPCTNLGYLLFTFFELFGCTFSYEDHGIRIDDLRGGRLECYAKRSVAGRFNRERPYLLSIEDPIQKERDIGTNCFGIRRVQRCFALAREFLCREPSDAANGLAAAKTNGAASASSSSNGSSSSSAFVIDTVGDRSNGATDAAAAAPSAAGAASAAASSTAATAAPATANPNGSSFSSSFGFILSSLLSLPVRYSIEELRRAAVKQPAWLPVVEKLERLERKLDKKEAKAARRETRERTASTTSTTTTPTHRPLVHASIDLTELDGGDDDDDPRRSARARHPTKKRASSSSAPVSAAESASDDDYGSDLELLEGGASRHTAIPIDDVELSDEEEEAEGGEATGEMEEGEVQRARRPTTPAATDHTGHRRSSAAGSSSSRPSPAVTAAPLSSAAAHAAAADEFGPLDGDAMLAADHHDDNMQLNFR